MSADPSTDAAAVRETFNYDSETGVFTWRTRGTGRRVNGRVGVVRRNGYLFVKFNGRQHRAHRLAWLWVHGEWPEGDVDHINGVRDDNRLANLRLATRAQNMQNQRRAQSRSRTGLLGVWPGNGGFRASIKVGGRRHYLGTFGTAGEAHAAYVAAKRQLHEFGML